jgi:ArsR family metal-binding transcriptional regulator
MSSGSESSPEEDQATATDQEDVKADLSAEQTTSRWHEIMIEIDEISNEHVLLDVSESAKEIYQYLPRTDCQICGEQNCYAFAIKLAGREIELDRCRPLLEAKYATNLEHIRTLLEYL